MSKSNTVVSFSAAAQRRAIERAAWLTSKIRELDSELGDIKAAFKALGDGTYVGKDHKIVVSTTDRTSLDQSEVKARLSPADYVQCITVKPVTTALVKDL